MVTRANLKIIEEKDYHDTEPTLESEENFLNKIASKINDGYSVIGFAVDNRGFRQALLINRKSSK